MYVSAHKRPGFAKRLRDTMVFSYSLTLFMSAFLLFVVQPMVGKMVLPLYGGTSAVWNTCMVFFQTMLLLGYAYAHISVKWLGPRLQPIAHFCLLFLPILVLPILITQDILPSAESDPVLWLLRKLFVTVGLPFFVLSSSAPLLQRWFSETMHPSSNDPYFLYAASNAGSLLGLLGYPIIIEPFLSLTEQSLFWSIGYRLLIIMIVICWIFLWRSYAPQNDNGNGSDGRKTLQAADQIALKQRLFWIFAAFIPSSLMLSVTSYITTNIAAVPLLWIVPFALYLLTFVMVFARTQLLSHLWLSRIIPFIIIPAAPFFFYSIKGGDLLLIPIHLLVFSVIAMVCHGELARSRPATRNLTEFYLLMSLGGVLGGLFNALAAPVIFNRIIEYPLLVFLACFIMPKLRPEQQSSFERKLDFVLPLSIAIFASIILFVVRALNLKPNLFLFALLYAPSALVCFGFKERSVRFALAFGVILVSLALFYDVSIGKQIYAKRNFFGIKKVVINREDKIRSLIHGTITHGSQFVDPSRRDEPLTYYHKSGPIGDVFEIFNRLYLNQNVAIIGLGVGSIASYSMPGQHFVFYEIDPDIELIARNNDYFTFLANSKGSYDIVIGDGRLTMRNAAQHTYGMIILDAFSSDAIPVHLLTKEAVMLYLSKLDSRGIIAVHISNNYVNLEPVLSNLAKELGLDCLVKHDVLTKKDVQDNGKYPSDYVVLGRFSPLMKQSLINAKWQKATSGSSNFIWTDQYSNIVQSLKW